MFVGESLVLQYTNNYKYIYTILSVQPAKNGKEQRLGLERKKERRGKEKEEKEKRKC